MVIFYSYFLRLPEEKPMGLIHPVGVAEPRPTNLMLKHVEIRKKSFMIFFPEKICYDLGHSYHLVGPEKEHRLSLAISHE